MRRRWSGRVHPWPGAEGEGLPQYRQTVLLCFALLADRRADWLESTVSAARLLEMACSTFMVIAITSAFWRPSAKECVKKQDLRVSPVIMCLDILKAV